MTIGFRFGAFALAATATLVFAACDGSRGNRPPTTPGPTEPGAQNPPTRIEITAPGEMEPGESVQLTAHVVKSDGSVEDVTGRAMWSSTDPSVVLLQQTTAVAMARGQAYIRATHGTRTTTKRIFVLPKGTFALQGVVHDHGIMIPDVTVEVLSGVGQGLTTKSNSGGRYTLFGVAAW